MSELCYEERGYRSERESVDDMYAELSFDSARISNLISAETSLPLEVYSNNTLRVKITDNCGLSCSFCHNEGTSIKTGRIGVSCFQDPGALFFSGEMNADDDGFASGLSLMHDIGSKKLQLTGGEPTRHRNLPSIIQKAKSIGYDTVGITTNGETGGRCLKEYKASGLDEVHVSILGLTPEEFTSTQINENREASKKAHSYLGNVKKMIDAAVENDLRLSFNVVLSNENHIERVKQIVDNYKSIATISLLKDLNSPNESRKAIYSLLCQLEAEPIQRGIPKNSSNYWIKYSINGCEPLYFRQTVRYSIPEVCDGCQFYDNDCAEGYYGLRFYIDKNSEYYFGPCVQRMDLAQKVGDFSTSLLCERIKL